MTAVEDLDYNYEYEKNGPHMKFSDWIPFRLHKWEPRHLEDFYELANFKLHYGEKDLLRNIYFLKSALHLRFRNPRQALCEIKSEDAYYKYRNLMFMHIYLGIMRNQMRLASLYDKRHLYFYNLDYAYDLKHSFTKSDKLFEEAIPYWEKAVEHAEIASTILIDLDLGTIESERYEIMNGKLDYGKIIETHRMKLDKKLNVVEDFLAKNPEANKPRL